jgi:glycosyltransferase involved in cell wall biosynthesis
MRVAVVHDHLGFIGGGERVALTLAHALDADLFATDVDPTLPDRANLPRARIAELARVPRTPFLRQVRQRAAFERVQLDGYDAYVLSGNWAVFAAPRHHPNLWYCYTPVRVFYDLRETFLGGLPWWKRRAAEAFIRRTQPAYESAVRQVDHIVGISRNVAGRIGRYLGREASVVYPPVDVARYRFDRVGDFWLSVNRLSHEKRIGLQMDAFRRLPGERLVVVGGPQMGVDAAKAIRAHDPPNNVEFLGEIEERKLLELYATCRGLVVTSIDEDFGLTPLEAMASGKPVVAVDDGGYRETVAHGETGWLVPPEPGAVADAIRAATPEVVERMHAACRARSMDFDVHLFVDRMRDLVARAAAGRSDRLTSS